jgi:signal transduction histidine kinase
MATQTTPVPGISRKQLWKYVRGLAPAATILIVVWIGAFVYVSLQWFEFWPRSDAENLKEWLLQSEVARRRLPELSRDYLEQSRSLIPEERTTAQEKLREHLAALTYPLLTYEGQVPLFLFVYQVELKFEWREGAVREETIAWNSWRPIPPRPGDRRQLKELLVDEREGKVWALVDYQLHVYDNRLKVEAEQRQYLPWLTLLGVAAFLLTTSWGYFFLKREREREIQEFLSQQQIEQAERQALSAKLQQQEMEHQKADAEHKRVEAEKELLFQQIEAQDLELQKQEAELKRQDAELRREDAERKLLEQRVAAQEADQRSLELKSHLYASIGIMAGSYAHNIKNLLVRPNDLLRRCLDADGIAPAQVQMLQEVQSALNTVTERLQQILKTVRRDPSHSEKNLLDLNQIVEETRHNWQDMSLQKWKLHLTVEPSPEPLHIQGDYSHLMQAVENLVVNARDATFEMRNHIREQVHRGTYRTEEEKRRAILAANAWKGAVKLRTLRQDQAAVLEVTDNGIGMTDEVRRRCAETYFSTKRDNALFEGNSTGMGLGLSFVQTILVHHLGRMEIESTPHKGTTFRLRFPLADGQNGNGPAAAVNADGSGRAK